jgi:hypothetical protein
MIPVWLLKLCHFIGLTDLTDQEVEKYALLRRRPKKPSISVDDTLFLAIPEPRSARSRERQQMMAGEHEVVNLSFDSSVGIYRPHASATRR